MNSHLFSIPPYTISCPVYQCEKSPLKRTLGKRLVNSTVRHKSWVLVPRWVSMLMGTSNLHEVVISYCPNVSITASHSMPQPIRTQAQSQSLLFQSGIKSSLT